MKLREGFSQAFVYNCNKHRLATKHHPRAACGIELAEVLVVTGGMETQSRVSAYNEDGFLADLPSLGQGRYNHACGHFVNTDNKMVGNLHSPMLTSYNIHKNRRKDKIYFALLKALLVLSN